LEAQAHPLMVVISKFIQLGMPLPPLKPMAQSRRGVTQIGEAQGFIVINQFVVWFLRVD
jgi:hypothetical protein